MLQRPWLSKNGDLDELDEELRTRVQSLEQQPADRAYVDPELLPQLTHGRPPEVLSGQDLPARKLPEPPVPLVVRPLAEQKSPRTLHDGREYRDQLHARHLVH